MQSHPAHPLRRFPVPEYNIFENEKFSDKYGNYAGAVYFRHQSCLFPPISPSLPPSLLCLTPSLPAVLIVFKGVEKHRPRGEISWFIDAPRSSRSPIITKVINNLRCLSGAWEYTSFDIPIVIRYYLRSPHRTGEQLTIVTLRSIMIIIVGDQARADALRCARAWINKAN